MATTNQTPNDSSHSKNDATSEGCAIQSSFISRDTSITSDCTDSTDRNTSDDNDENRECSSGAVLKKSVDNATTDNNNNSVLQTQQSQEY